MSNQRTRVAELVEVITRLRTRTLTALSLLVLTLVITQIGNLVYSAKLDRHAELINVAGRQRMLSQRLPLLAGQLHESSDPSEISQLKQLLEQETSTFRTSHERLLYSTETRGFRQTHSDLKQLQEAVDEIARTAEFYAVANDASLSLRETDGELNPADDLKRLRESAFEFLPRMDHIVDRLEASSVARHARFRWGAIVLLAIAAASVIPIWFKLILPMIRQASLAAELVRRSERAKTEFFANMSHEIRTPLTAIIGFTDLMMHEYDHVQDQEEIENAVRTINSNGKHLLAIINDVLDLSKIESGNLIIEKIPCQLTVIVEEVASLLRPLAIQKRLELRISCASDIPSVILSDPVRLRQILLNLVGNAIKFTELGYVDLRVTFDSQAGKVGLDVKDTGVGMTPPQLKTVREFNAFTQADGTTTRRFGGTGLGLRISNSLVHMLGGSMEIDSEFGKGARFNVKIPVEISTNEEALAGNGRAHRRRSRSIGAESDINLNGLRILLAEDGPDNQKLIRFVLEKSGAAVTVVGNGKAAVDAAMSAKKANDSFNVILMDIQMPVMDGYAAMRQLRQSDYDDPIIALTAHAMLAEREKCIRCGCNAFATKPINRETLIQTIYEVHQKSVNSVEPKATPELVTNSAN